MQRLQSIGQLEVLIPSKKPQFAYSVSSDGKYLLFGKIDEAETKNDIWVLPLDGSAEPEPV